MAQSKNEKIQKLELEMSKVVRTESLLNSNQVQKIFNSTPKNFQYERAAKGGGTWTYVKSSYVRKVLDSVFGFNWDFEIETTLSEAFEVAKLTNTCVVKGTITARVKKDGNYVEVRKTQFGRAEVKWKMQGSAPNRIKVIDEFSKAPLPLDFGNDMKAATSDCLKKCASMFGIAADIYEKEEFVEIHLSDSDDHSEKSKGVKKQVELAKKQLEAEDKA